MKLLVAMCLLAAGVSAGNFGQSGIVYPDGRQVQFNREQADNIAVIGHSGATTHDGSHIQFNRHGVPRSRREASVLLKGSSGLIFEDGQQRHLGRGHHVVHSGPSGTVLSNGNNVQHSHNKRSAVIGKGGIITPGGKQIQLPHGVSVLLAGPSAAMLSNGESIQYEH